MTFILLLLAWIAFIASLFSLLEQVLRGVEFRKSFFRYFLIGFYAAFAWLVVITLLHRFAPDSGLNQLFVVTPLFPPIANLVASILKLRRPQ